MALPPVSVSALQRQTHGESSAVVRARVERAREAQGDRARRKETSGWVNAALSPHDVEKLAALCPQGERLLSAAVARLGLSARAYGKVLRVARTIADLDGKDAVSPEHVAEAISLRVLDRHTHPGVRAA